MRACRPQGSRARAEYIIPSVFNKKVVPAVARAAQQTGAAPRGRRPEISARF